MSNITLRPRYRFELPLGVEDVRQQLKAALKDAALNRRGLQHRAVSHHIILVLPSKLRHYWSPILDISLEQQPNGHTTLRALIGPEPAIWTMFMFVYTLGGLIATAGLVLGTSQYMLGKGFFYLSLIPIGLGLMAIFYFIALGGKRKAHEQSQWMLDFLEGVFGKEFVHVESSEY